MEDAFYIFSLEESLKILDRCYWIPTETITRFQDGRYSTDGFRVSHTSPFPSTPAPTVVRVAKTTPPSFEQPRPDRFAASLSSTPSSPLITNA